MNVIFSSRSKGRDIDPHRKIKSTEYRQIDLIFFFVKNAATRRYEVAKRSKISTYLFTNSGHSFFGVTQKRSTNTPWNFDLRFVSEETWIKSSFSVGLRSDAMCLLCTAEATSGEIAHLIQFVEVKGNCFFQTLLTFQ